MINHYSRTWFELFLEPIDQTQTEHEVRFLARHLPRPRYHTILDLCCGAGRHACLLARHGYAVTGLDRDAAALAVARQASGDYVRYVEQDMRRLDALGQQFDAVVCLWQSFGYFDHPTNRAILQQIRDILGPGGRCILDIYHRGFFEQQQGVRHFDRGGVEVTERKRMLGDRLQVELEYGDAGVIDRFDWQLWTPDELRALAAACSFDCVLVCSAWDESALPSAAVPRMQCVLERSTDR